MLCNVLPVVVAFYTFREHARDYRNKIEFQYYHQKLLKIIELS